MMRAWRTTSQPPPGAREYLASFKSRPTVGLRREFTLFDLPSGGRHERTPVSSER